MTDEFAALRESKLQTPTLLGAISLFLLLGLTAWAYLPGLNGELIFDDIPNLQPWASLQDITSRVDVLTFVFSGTGLPGRPLSLLSFLIDDQSWPPDIFALKRTNLAIHLLNLCLTLWLCLKLLRRLLPAAPESRILLLSFLATALWALHPLQVSNVSYIIQRMNLLSTLLELMGLLIFVYGRERLAESPWKAMAICSVGIGLFMPLAVLAKENGLLLCAFALLVERFCYAPAKLQWWRAWKMLFLWLPLLVFAAYCILRYQGFTRGFEIRDFNAWERLLSQGPVVVDYLEKLLLPRLHGTGLYFDNFPVSRSLLQPISTLYSWLLLLGLMAAAVVLRHRMPITSFGIWFYFTGHLMESTLIPLELYFEHRNYLPQVGLWIALAGLLNHVSGRRLQIIVFAAVAILFSFLVTLTRQNAALWSQPELQSAVWYHENPGSLRTTLSYANLLLQKQRLEKLHQVLDTGRQHHPDSLAIVVSQRYVSCYWQDQPTPFDDLPALARRAEYESASIVMLEQIRELSTRKPNGAALHNCVPANDQQIAATYEAMLTNPRFARSRTRARLNEYLAEMAVQRRDLNTAMEFYDRAFKAEANPIYPYRQARLLLSAGLVEDAHRYATLAVDSNKGRSSLLYPDLKARIRVLESEIESASKTK